MAVNQKINLERIDKMNKSDLKAGYLVKLRNRRQLIIAEDKLNLITAVDKSSVGFSLKDYNDDLHHKSNCNYDIVEVCDEANSYGRRILWKRPEPKELYIPFNISINDFAADVYRNAVVHGWYEEDTVHSFGDTIALCHSELSEALEEYRNDKPLVYFYDDDEEIEIDMNLYDGQKLEGIATEMIDCILRILDWCSYNDVNIEWLLAKKHEYNKTRPYKHGGKII